MGYNMSASWGQLDSILLGAKSQAGKTMIVGNSSNPNWSRFLQMYTPDQDGNIRLFSTVAEACAAITDGMGDTIYVSPGFYDESVTITGKSNFSIVGLGGRGAAGLEPSTAGAEGLTLISCDDVTLQNFGVAADDTGTAALTVTSCARFRAIGCKFEGSEAVGGAQVLINGTADDQTADLLLQDCELAWGTNGVLFDNSAEGYPTQIVIKDCWFHDLTTSHLGVAADGLVVGLLHKGNVHDTSEDGTPPTDFILLSDNGNIGTITGNYFASATNDTATITIGTGLLYMANATEAGWSTARPA